MDMLLEGVIRDNLVTEENKNDVIYFSYSAKAAKSLGYHTAILNNGEKINFTCQTTTGSFDDYKWEDKVQFDPIKMTDIAQWQYDNYLSAESKFQNVMQRRMEDEAMFRSLQESNFRNRSI